MAHEFTVPTVGNWKTIIRRIVKGMSFAGIDPDSVSDGSALNMGVEDLAANTGWLKQRLPLSAHGIVTTDGSGTPSLSSSRSWFYGHPLAAVSIDGPSGSIQVTFDSAFTTALAGVAPVVGAQLVTGSTSFGHRSYRVLVHDVTTSGFKVQVIRYLGLAYLTNRIDGDLDTPGSYPKRTLGILGEAGRVFDVRCLVRDGTADATEELSVDVYKSPSPYSSFTSLLSSPMILDDGVAAVGGDLSATPGVLDVPIGSAIWYDVVRTAGAGDVMKDLFVQVIVEQFKLITDDLVIAFNVTAPKF